MAKESASSLGKEAVSKCSRRLFDVIHEAHINSGHGGRDKLTVALKKIFWNA